MKGFVVVTQQLPYKVKTIPQSTIVVSENVPCKIRPIFPRSNKNTIIHDILNRTVKESDLTVHITNQVRETLKKDGAKIQSVYVDREPTRNWVVEPKSKSVYVEKVPSRNWVITTGRVNIPDLPFNIGDIFVDAQTGKVFIYETDDESFQLVELGYYSDFCEETEYYESDTIPVDAIFGDRWLNTSTGILFTLIKNEADEDTWAQVGQPSGICEGNDLFYARNNPLGTTPVETGDRWFDETKGALYTYAFEPTENWIELE